MNRGSLYSCLKWVLLVKRHSKIQSCKLLNNLFSLMMSANTILQQNAVLVDQCSRRSLRVLICTHKPAIKLKGMFIRKYRV